MSKYPEEDGESTSANLTGTSLSNTDESSKILKETLSGATGLAVHANSSKHPTNTTDNIRQSNDTFKNQEPGIAVKCDQKSEFSCSSVDKKLPSCPTTSIPVIHREVAVDSSIVSDTTPLLKDRHSSVSSCTEGETSEASCDCSYLSSKDSDSSSSNTMLTASQTREHLMVPGSVRVPIVGHETLESRSRFTVFKIHVMVKGDEAGWFIFRRYSDFVHLNDQLKILFPNFRLALPPKRWFRNNFDGEFLDERVLGLQAFVDNVTGHQDICKSKPVRDFFCFDDPPGPYDSLEESRAQCESQEEVLYSLKQELLEKDTEIDILKEELDLYKNQVQLLTNRLSIRSFRRRCQSEEITMMKNLEGISSKVAIYTVVVNIGQARFLYELNRRTSFETSDKHRSPNGDRKIRIDALLHSGEKLITNKLNTVSEIKSVELKGHDLTSTET